MKRSVLASVILAILVSNCELAFAEGGHDSPGGEGASHAYQPTQMVQYVATALFALAVVHTFLVGKFRVMAHKFPTGSKMENLFHLLGEVEAVFLMWAAALFVGLLGFQSWHDAVMYIETRDFTEPKFVFVIMAIAATRPIIELVDAIIRGCSVLLRSVTPLSESASFLMSALIVGPLLGSLVTEPASMTVTSLVLLKQFFDRDMSKKFMYVVIGTLFVNVSIGGTLTSFAAPPVLMVAKTWNWGTTYMFLNFGWKAVVACVINASIVTLCFLPELKGVSLIAADKHSSGGGTMSIPGWVTAIHVMALAFTVLTSHHSDVFFGGFVLFLGFCAVTQEYQGPIKLKESLLVGGFLAGLVTMGGLQDWWLRPVIASLGEFPLFVGTTGLTAVTDNAALTYLGSQVGELSDGLKYALVAGAVTGGGLTVIANAPNPAGYSILNPAFEKRFNSGISPLGLLAGALPATAVAFACMWLIP